MVRSDCNTVQGFVNDMVSETSNTDIPTVVKDNNKKTVANKLGKAKPVVIHVNNNSNMKLGNTGLKFSNTFGAHIVEEKEERFYEWADKYDVWNGYSYAPTEENELGSSHIFTGDNSILKLTKTKHNGKLKTRVVSKVSTSIKSDFYIGEHQSSAFEANY